MDSKKRIPHARHMAGAGIGRGLVLSGLSLMALTLADAGLHHALAQDAAATSPDLPNPAPTSPNPAPADGGDRLQEIVVTGSRIARRDYTADSPIVTVGQQYLDAQAGGTVGIKLQQLPQFTPGANELTGSGQPTGRATVDLRGLGANRTLVLADGRRLQPSTSDVVVDLNTIPSALIENIEVITGGASAIYGSDAIAGVVNLKLKKDFQGLELNGQYNITELGDGQEYTLDGLVGTNFADNRGNIVFSMGYLDRGSAYFRKRDFYRQAFAQGAPPWGSDLLPQGNFIPDGSNLPSQATVDAVFAGYGYAPGTVANSNALSFNGNGSLFSQYGAYNYTGAYNDSYVLSPFSNSVAYNLGTLQLLTAPTKRVNAFTHAEYELTDNITAYGQAMFTSYRSITNYGAGLQTQGTTAVVPVDNAFIPADLQTLLASRADPDAPFSMHKLWTQTGSSITKYENTVFQVMAGLKGKFGSSDWSWDIYGSHGETKIEQSQKSGGASFSRIQQLLTSRSVTGTDGSLVNVPAYIAASGGGNSLIPNPAYATAVNDGGRSVAAADGSIPCPDGLNLFSDAPLSASCAAYLQIHPNNVTRLKQDVIEGTIQGGVFDLPAGRVQVAIGGSYRRNSYSYSPDPAATDLVGSFLALPVNGSTDVKEGYIEALVPVIRDKPFFRSVDLDLAYRYSKYPSGGVNTYKASVDWAVDDSFRLRGGYQRAIRAPNVIEYYNPAVPTAALLGQEDPCNFDSAARTGANGAQVRDLCLAQGVPASIIDSYKSTFAGTQAVQQGNLDLKPEKADTYTAGFAWKPSFGSPLFERFSTSVDYYRINLTGAISTLSADIVFSRCFNQNGENPGYDQSNSYCQSILRNSAAGTPDQVLTPYFNLGGLRTSGIDFQLDWGFGLGAVGLDDKYGALDLNVVVNRLIDFKVQASPGAEWVDYIGTQGYGATGNNGAHPRWKANTSLSWSLDGKMLGLRWYYVGPMEDIYGGPGLNGYSRFDLFASAQLNDVLQLSAGINNLFDKDPLKTFGGLPGNTDSGTYDPLGRRYYLAIKAKF